MFVHHYHGICYHYLVPHARRNDWDSTLCSHPLPSQNGVTALLEQRADRERLADTLLELACAGDDAH